VEAVIGMAKKIYRDPSDQVQFAVGIGGRLHSRQPVCFAEFIAQLAIKLNPGDYREIKSFADKAIEKIEFGKKFDIERYMAVLDARLKSQGQTDDRQIVPGWMAQPVMLRIPDVSKAFSEKQPDDSEKN
jgi:hypothetical protein